MSAKRLYHILSLYIKEVGEDTHGDKKDGSVAHHIHHAAMATLTLMSMHALHKLFVGKHFVIFSQLLHIGNGHPDSVKLSEQAGVGFVGIAPQQEFSDLLSTEVVTEIAYHQVVKMFVLHVVVDLIYINKTKNILNGVVKNAIFFKKNQFSTIFTDIFSQN